MANAQKALADMQFKWDVQQPGNRASSTTLKAAESRLVVAEDRMNRAKGVYDSAPSSDDERKAQTYLNYAAAVQEYQSALASVNWYRGKPNDNDQAILDAQLAVAKAQLEDAQRAWERVKDGPDEGDVSAAQARVDAARASLELAEIKAPFAGTITFVEVKPGDQVAPGSLAFGLADLSRLLVDVEVSEVDIDRVEPGQDVTLSFDAVPDKSYQGTVTEVGQIGTAVQGVVNFEVEVEVLEPDASIKPGMTAAVNVVVSYIENVLLVPNRAVRVQDGQRVVFVMRDGLPVSVEITLGASSETDSEVLEGDLQPGDLIVLNPPLIFSQNGPPGFVSGMRGG
jgi:HlyD family secretion protein